MHSKDYLFSLHFYANSPSRGERMVYYIQTSIEWIHAPLTLHRFDRYKQCE